MSMSLPMHALYPEVAVLGSDALVWRSRRSERGLGMLRDKEKQSCDRQTDRQTEWCQCLNRGMPPLSRVRTKDVAFHSEVEKYPNSPTMLVIEEDHVGDKFSTVVHTSARENDAQSAYSIRYLRFEMTQTVWKIRRKIFWCESCKTHYPWLHKFGLKFCQWHLDTFSNFCFQFCFKTSLRWLENTQMAPGKPTHHWIQITIHLK